MVRKISVMLSLLVLIFGLAVTAQATSYTAYDGTMSSTYVTYFKDIISGMSFKDNYVAFRSSQYDYVMVTGDIEYNESKNTFTLNGDGDEYIFTTSSGYNSDNSYSHNSITHFVLNAGNEMVYSDLGNFPQLMDRGAKYEMLTTLLLSIFLLGSVIMRFFHSR